MGTYCLRKRTEKFPLYYLFFYLLQDLKKKMRCVVLCVLVLLCVSVVLSMPHNNRKTLMELLLKAAKRDYADGSESSYFEMNLANLPNLAKKFTFYTECPKLRSKCS